MLTTNQMIHQSISMQRDVSFDLVYQVVRTSGRLLRASRRFFRPYGLSEAQFNVLNLLRLHPPGMIQRDLGDALLVDRSNVTGLVDRLEKLGWVRREATEGDRRAFRVVMTEAGAELMARVLPAYEAEVRRLVADLGAKRASRLLEELKHLDACIEVASLRLEQVEEKGGES